MTLNGAGARLGTPAPWLAIIGVMISGTVGFVGIWITMSAQRDSYIERIVMMETTVRSNTEWRNKAEQQIQDLNTSISNLSGQLEVLRREHESLENQLHLHIQDDDKRYVHQSP